MGGPSFLATYTDGGIRRIGYFLWVSDVNQMSVGSVLFAPGVWPLYNHNGPVFTAQSDNAIRKCFITGLARIPHPIGHHLKA